MATKVHDQLSQIRKSRRKPGDFGSMEARLTDEELQEIKSQKRKLLLSKYKSGSEDAFDAFYGPKAIIKSNASSGSESMYRSDQQKDTKIRVANSRTTAALPSIQMLDNDTTVLRSSTFAFGAAHQMQQNNLKRLASIKSATSEGSHDRGETSQKQFLDASLINGTNNIGPSFKILPDVTRQSSLMNILDQPLKRSLSKIETSMLSPMAITNYYNTTIKHEASLRAAKPPEKMASFRWNSQPMTEAPYDPEHMRMTFRRFASQVPNSKDGLTAKNAKDIKSDRSNIETKNDGGEICSEDTSSFIGSSLTAKSQTNATDAVSNKNKQEFMMPKNNDTA